MIPPQIPAAGRKWTFVILLPLATLVLGICLFWLTRASQAQGGGIVVDKRLGRASPVVRVGEYLTFTIAIRSEVTFTIVTVPLSDTFDSYILAYGDADPPPSGVTTTTNPGQLWWPDLTDTFGDLLPGETITVTLGFTAVHPTEATVNAARVEGAEGSSGQQVGEANGRSDEGEVVGGNTPVQKSLDPSMATLQINSPITFTITITNDGAATLTFLPLEDTYDPAVLLFHRAIPTPSLVLTASGIISWFDLTVHLGDVPPDSAVTVTTIFTALMPASSTNSAQVAGARDRYENDLGIGADQVPITIIADTPTPTPPLPPAPPLLPSPTPTPWPTATPVPTPTLLSVPGVLPETGAPWGIPVLSVLGGLVIMTGLIVAVCGWLRSPVGERKRRVDSPD